MDSPPKRKKSRWGVILVIPAIIIGVVHIIVSLICVFFLWAGDVVRIKPAQYNS